MPRAADRVVPTWAAVVVTLCIGSVLVLAAALWFRSAPMADDWVRAGMPLASLFEEIAHNYRHWFGRWASILVAVTSFGLIPPDRAYWVLLCGASLVAVLGVHVVTRTVLGPDVPRRVRGAATVLLTTLLWAGMPHPGDTVYWYSGAVENQIGIAVGACLVCALVRGSRGGAAQGWTSTTALLVLAVFVTGLHEVFGAMLWIALAAGSLLARRLRVANHAAWYAVLAAASLGLLLVMAAPGNRERPDTFPYAWNLSRAYLSFKHMVRTDVLSWVLDVKLLALSVLLVVHPATRALRPRWIDCCPAVWRRMFPALTVACVALGLAVPALAMGIPCAERTKNGVYLVFLFGWFCSLFAATRFGEPPLPGRAARSLATGALLAFALAVVFSPHTESGLRDVQDRTQSWLRAHGERYRLAREAVARGQGDVVFAPLPKRPRMCLTGDLSDSIYDAANRGFAAYFGLRSVRVLAPD